MRLAHRAVRAATRLLLPVGELAEVERLALDDAGHGYDALGMHRDWVGLAAAVLLPMHRYYFRVQAQGAEHIPQHGPAILVANHGGMLPLDAAMLGCDVWLRTRPARVLRPSTDFFVPRLPIVGTIFSRIGMASGTPSNVRHLLQRGELVLVFPEGTAAIGKPKSERYQIQKWSIGHAELALRYGVPVVPVGIVGPEEQWHELTRLTRIPLFGAPYLPVPVSLVPLPVRYHIRYGSALHFGSPHPRPDPERVERAAQTTRKAVDSLIAGALQERKGLFL